MYGRESPKEKDRREGWENVDYIRHFQSTVMPAVALPIGLKALTPRQGKPKVLLSQ